MYKLNISLHHQLPIHLQAQNHNRYCFQCSNHPSIQIIGKSSKIQSYWKIFIELSQSGIISLCKVGETWEEFRDFDKKCVKKKKRNSYIMFKWRRVTFFYKYLWLYFVISKLKTNKQIGFPMHIYNNTLW